MANLNIACSILALLLISVHKNEAKALPPDCATVDYDVIDVIFVLDGSYSVKIGNFQKMLEFVRKIVENLPIGDQKAHVGVVQYSTNVESEVSLDQFSDKKNLSEAISRIKYMNHNTLTGKAINFTTYLLNKKAKRKDVSKAMMLMTDGASQDFVKPPADEARSSGIKLIALGITDNVNMKELREIVGNDEKSIIQVKDFTDTDKVVAELTSKVHRSVNPECFDRAGSIQVNLKAEGKTTGLWHGDKTKLRCNIIPMDQNAKYFWSRNNELISPSGHDITVSTGVVSQMVNNASEALHPKLVQFEDNGAAILIKSFGTNTKGAYTCKAMNSIGVLQNSAESIELRLATCKAASADKMDVLFLLEGSDEVTNDKFQSMVDFIHNVVEHFEIGLDKTNVGVVQYYEWSEEDVPLIPKQEKLKLLEDITSLHHIDMDGKQVGEAINYAMGKFDNTNGRPKMIVVLSDGSSNDDVTGPAKAARVNGIQLFTVGTTQSADHDQLKRIVDKDAARMFLADDLSSADDVATRLYDALKLAADAATCKVKTHLTTVQGKPKLVEGQTLTLKCSMATTNHPVDYTWYRNSVAVEDLTDILFDSTDDSSLITIKATKPEFEGLYTCSGVDAINANASSPENVTVSITIPTRISEPPRYSERKIQIYDSIKIPCRAFGHPAPKITWQKNHRKVPNDNNLKVENDGTLTISKALKNHEGLYKCVARNKFGPADVTVSIIVQSLHPTISDSKNETITAFEGNTFELTCNATGIPEVSIQWHFNDNEITNGTDFDVQNGTLFIKQVDPRHGGEYKCIAQNILGNDIRIVNVNVEDYQAYQARIQNSDTKNESCNVPACDSTGMDLVQKVTAFIDQVTKLMANLTTSFKDCLTAA